MHPNLFFNALIDKILNKWNYLPDKISVNSSKIFNTPNSPDLRMSSKNGHIELSYSEISRIVVPSNFEDIYCRVKMMHNTTPEEDDSDTEQAFRMNRFIQDRTVK